MWSFMEEDEEDPVETPEEALAELTMGEMRSWAKAQGLMPKPAPRKKNDLIKALLPNATLDMLQPVLAQKHEQERMQREKTVEEERCKLLVHTLTMSIYTLQRYYQVKSNTRSPIIRHWRARSVGGDPVEDELAAEFNAGEIRTVPPFFPGDRNSLGVERTK